MEGHDISPSLTELHEKLLNHEAKLMTNAPPSSFPITANYVNNNRSLPVIKQNQTTQTWRPQNNRGPRPYLGKCQICGVQGHSAKRCHQLQSMAPKFGQSQPLLLRPPYPPTPWLPWANLTSTTPNSVVHNPWVLDSGVTHHITLDLNNLAHHQPYHGGEEVLIGDGSGLKISHTAFVSLPSKSHDVSLRDVLHVPEIWKNLIFVYRLCNANGAFVELFPSYF